MTRQLPQNLEAERSVLGVLFLRGASAYAEVAPILDADHFYHPLHGLLYREIGACVAANQPVDLVVLCARMEQSGSLQRLSGVGGAAFITEIAISAANFKIKHYAAIVREAALARAVVLLCSELSEKGYQGVAGAQLLQEAQTRFFDLGMTSTVGGEPEPFKKVMHDAICELEHRYDGRTAITGVAAGLTELDELTNGWQRGDLIVLCGRPGSGKSALAMQAAIHAATSGVPTLCFHLEMSREQVGARALSAEARVDGTAVRTGMLTGDDWIRISKNASRLSDSKLWLDDSQGQGLAAITAKATRWRASACSGNADKPGLVVVDFLQLVSGARAPGKTREQEVGEISRGLKGLAKQLRCPVLAVASLSRKCEERADKRPIQSDLKESGSIESDADLILGVYREAMYSAEADPEEAEILVLKHRNGPTGCVKARWLGRFTRFESWH